VQQKILNVYPSQPLKVYVIWQPIHRPDTLAAANTAAHQLFKDKRVVHLWDGNNEIGYWYKLEGSLDIKSEVMWDACYLYSADAVWNDKPDQQIQSGRPVVKLTEAFIQALQSEWSRMQSR